MTMPGPAISVENVSLTLGEGQSTVPVLHDVSLRVNDGEFFSIIGPSGCGKSTLLNLIAGLETPDRGTITVGDARNESRLGATGYMPQKDLLLPWRNVRDNAALALELTGVSRAEARARADALLDRFGLAGFGDAWPSTLSGGMRQRAAFLRTVLTGRQILLLDEPFGALDALTRRSMQTWLLQLWDEIGRTVLLVTHDVDEALLLSDRIAVMSQRPGTILQSITVDIPRPRHAEVSTSPAFIERKRQLLDALDGRTEVAGAT